MVGIFHDLRKRHPLFALPELRHRVTATRYRIPDVAVYAGHRPTERVPATAPYVAIEIVSPDDRYSEIVLKLEEYRLWGAPFIWLVDPQVQKVFVFDSAGLRQVERLVLPDYNVSICPPDIFDASEPRV